MVGRGKKKLVVIIQRPLEGLPKLVRSAGDGPRAGALPAVAKLGSCRIEQVYRSRVFEQLL